MQTFAKLALAAGACALGLGAVLPAQAAARRVWLSAAAGRIRHLRRAAIRRRAGAVLARLRTALCLWLRALARLSALVSARRLLIAAYPSCPAIAVRRTASLRSPMCRASTPFFAAKQKTWMPDT